MKEIWKDIKGFEGLYQVSNIGQVKNVEGKIVNQNFVGKGYLQVCLRKDKKNKYAYVHRLVAEAFVPNPENKPEVNHINEDKTDNRVENLNWMTRAENINHGTRNKRAGIANRKARSKAVLQLTLDGEVIKEWASTREAGRNGFDQSSITKCCKGKLKTHKGYKWNYK